MDTVRYGLKRGECKTPGGKLVGVNVRFAAGRPVECRVDGDFFIEGKETAATSLIADVESTLLAVGTIPGTTGTDPTRGGEGHRYIDGIAESVAAVIGRHPEARLAGTGAWAIATAYARAMFGEHDAPWNASGNVNGAKTDRGADTDGAGIGGARTRDISDDSVESGGIAEADEWRRRWAALRPLVIVDRPRSPAGQMNIDEQWAREVAQGIREPTIRFWQWTAPAVVVGRFQSIPDEVHERRAAAEGFAVVRRCTGGGAMFIEPGNTITYSLYAPRSFVAGMSVERSYHLCDQWLIDALHGLGVEARFSGLNDIASPHGKIGGAAQRRFTGPIGAVLHHVTMAYDIDAERMARILNTSAEKMSDKAVRSVRKRVDPLRSQTGLERDMIVEGLAEYLRGL